MCKPECCCQSSQSKGYTHAYGAPLLPRGARAPSWPRPSTHISYMRSRHRHLSRHIFATPLHVHTSRLLRQQPQPRRHHGRRHGAVFASLGPKGAIAVAVTVGVGMGPGTGRHTTAPVCVPQLGLARHRCGTEMALQCDVWWGTGRRACMQLVARACNQQVHTIRTPTPITTCHHPAPSFALPI